MFYFLVITKPIFIQFIWDNHEGMIFQITAESLKSVHSQPKYRVTHTTKNIQSSLTWEPLLLFWNRLKTNSNRSMFLRATLPLGYHRHRFQSYNTPLLSKFFDEKWIVTGRYTLVYFSKINLHGNVHLHTFPRSSEFDQTTVLKSGHSSSTCYYEV